MTALSIERFAEELVQTVMRVSWDDGVSREEAFTSNTFVVLQDNHEAYEPKEAYYRGRRAHVNGYDLSVDRDECDIYVTDFDSEMTIHTISNTDVRRYCENATEFVIRAINGQLDDVELEEPRQCIEALRDHADILERIRVIVLTNRRALRVALPESVRVNNDKTEVEYTIVDIERLFYFSQSSVSDEQITIDFEMDHGGALPALRFDYDDGRPYDLVLTLVPGKVLSDIYREWQQRLLQQNVRAYLTARGGVNRGMRETIRDTPTMFAAYNNGLCATAESAVVEIGRDGMPRLVRVVGFQIVNGGQTTASLFDASRLFNLSPTAVPMKLVIVKQQEHIDDLVKEISKYTNSQNKVSVSDLVANERFHRDLERESRAAVTPAPTGMIGTQWFYERARAQYADERARQTTPTQRARWERDHPYKQKLTKTLVAKYEMAWGQYPHTVCLGAEKNYNAFQAMCDVTPIRVTPLYFRELVARAIVFQACDKVAVPLAPGWKANTVAYAVAAFSYAYGALFDHISVWERQAVTPATLEALKDLVVMARDHLSAPPVSGQNIGEWSKRPACWEQFKEKVQQRYIARPLVSAVADVEVDTPNLDARIHRPELVASAVWLQLHAWGSENDRLTSQQKQACLNLAAASAAGRRANPSFYRLGSEVVRRAVEAGFELPPLA